MKRMFITAVALAVAAVACSHEGGYDVDVLMRFATAPGPDQYLQEQWTEFVKTYATQAHVVVTGGDFPAIYQDLGLPKAFPGFVGAGDAGTHGDAGSRVDAGVYQDASASREDAGGGTDAGAGKPDVGGPPPAPAPGPDGQDGGGGGDPNDGGAAADGGAATDGGAVTGGEGQTTVVQVSVKVQVPQGVGRTFGVVFAGPNGVTTFGGSRGGVDVGEGMAPVEIMLLPYVALAGKVHDVKEIVSSQYEDMMVGTVSSHVFAEQPSKDATKTAYTITAVGSVPIDSGAFPELLTPYNADVFLKDGLPITYASVFLHASSDNGAAGFCVPGAAEYPGTGLEPGLKLGVDLYMSMRDSVGTKKDALLSCVSPRILAYGSQLDAAPTAYVSFMARNEPKYVVAVVNGPDQFEARFDDRPEQGGTLQIPGLDVGFVKDIEDLYMGFRMFRLNGVEQFTDGTTLNVHLEIGYGSETFTTNEVQVQISKPASHAADGGTPSDGGTSGDAGVDVKDASI